MTVVRAGLSGTNWVGKSTTIRRFIEAHPELSIETVALSSLVSECPHPVIQQQTPQASRWMVERVRALIGRPIPGDVQLFDRTPLDILAFTHYAYDLAGKPIEPELIASILELLAEFTVVFHAPVEEEWPVGVHPPPIDVAFALLMDRYMDQAIRRYDLEVVGLPWEIAERLRVIEARVTRTR